MASAVTRSLFMTIATISYLQRVRFPWLVATVALAGVSLSGCGGGDSYQPTTPITTTVEYFPHQCANAESGALMRRGQNVDVDHGFAGRPGVRRHVDVPVDQQNGGHGLLHDALPVGSGKDHAAVREHGDVLRHAALRGAGLRFQEPGGGPLVRKHTLPVQPAGPVALPASSVCGGQHLDLCVG
jgi:hypothetical protein